MISHFEATTVQHQGSAEEATGTAWRQQLAFLLRQAEAAVGGSVGVGACWLAATSPSGNPALWLFSLASLAVGLWSWLRRPAEPAAAALRGMVLLAGAFLVQTRVGASGVSSAEFFVVVAIVFMYYASILPAAWGFATSVAVGAGVLLTVLASVSGSGSGIGLEGPSALLLLPLLPVAGKVVAQLRRAAAQPEDVRIDSSTSLYNRSGFLVQGRLLLAECRMERRELTLAVLDCNDLLEAREIYGKRTTRKLIDRIVAKLTLLAGERGIAARTGPTQFALALPMPRERATQIIERVLGNPVRIEFGEGESEIVLLPSLMVEAVSPGGSFERMFAALCRGLTRVRDEEELRQRYLQRERERHSRPMAPTAVAPRAVATRTPVLDADPLLPPLPGTLPMPLPAR